uniref:TonB-dependent receptor domain-containing protein n=2 Tax=Bacteria TaxID=2 RepID=UPI0034E95A28
EYEETFNVLLPKLSLAYKVSDEINIGALINKGYIPGGTGINFRGGEYYTFDEEYAWNYELFTRMSFLEQRFTIDANVFYTQFKDSQRAVTDYLD